MGIFQKCEERGPNVVTTLKKLQQIIIMCKKKREDNRHWVLGGNEVIRSVNGGGFIQM